MFVCMFFVVCLVLINLFDLIWFDLADISPIQEETRSSTLWRKVLNPRCRNEDNTPLLCSYIAVVCLMHLFNFDHVCCSFFMDLEEWRLTNSEVQSEMKRLVFLNEECCLAKIFLYELGELCRCVEKCAFHRVVSLRADGGSPEGRPCRGLHGVPRTNPLAGGQEARFLLVAIEYGTNWLQNERRYDYGYWSEMMV